MGEVKRSDKRVMDALGIDKVPSLLVLSPGKEKRHMAYNGKLKYLPLYDFLSSIASEPTEGSSNDRHMDSPNPASQLSIDSTGKTSSSLSLTHSLYIP